jgi:type VI secretion system protein ImpA
MINTEELLKPVSAAEPCGADISYDPDMHQLETLLRGKPETQFSPAEEPQWEKLEELSASLLERSKNLRVAVVLCLAALRNEGLPGFRDGLGLIRELLERYWDGLYPHLDPEDNNDPTERVNILTPLVTPVGSFDDPMRFLEGIRESYLAESMRIGRFSLVDIIGGGGSAPADSSTIQAAFRDTSPEKLAARSAAIIEAAATARAIDAFLTSTIGADRALDWAPLVQTLEEVRKALAPHVSGASAPLTGGGGAANAAAATTPVAGPPGAINSRQDVIETLERICEYYRRAEPSSPLPVLLERARRLVDKGFLEIVADLSPEAIGSFQHMTGAQPAPTVGSTSGE